MPIDLRAERLVDPIGLGTPTPRLSWRLAPDDRETDVVQVAARVLVGEAGADAAMWDSGVVESRRMQLRYAGPPLASRSRCWWRVRAWTEAGSRGTRRERESTGTASFELGLLSGSDWEARMIRPAGQVGSAAVRFSTPFDVEAADPVVAARLYLSAHGIVLPLLNRVEVTDELLAPGWTSYRHRLAVRTIDVTPHVRAGRNELSLVVAPGWFSGRLGWEGKRALYGDYCGALAQLEVLSASGERLIVATGRQGWTASATPWLEADLYDGETYDGRHAMASAGPPVPVEEVDLDLDRTLVAPAAPPVRRTAVLAPQSVRRLDDGTLAVDVGQNLSGWLRLRLAGVPAGGEIVLRHAEVLDRDGRLFTAPLRTARCTDRYVSSGPHAQVYEPRFTFHGFRYAEIAGVRTDATVGIEAVAIHSDLERTGAFTCSDPLVNRLHENVVWGWRGNSVSVPTDCPQRDERLGWTGDLQVFAPTATYLYDCQTFLESWLADLRADQMGDGGVPAVIPDFRLGQDAFLVGLAGWGDAGVVVPWVLYVAYGDESVLRDSLPSMIACVDRQHALLDEDGVWTHPFQFGDWLDPDAPTEKPWQAKARPDLVATAYVARATDLLARTARVLGEDALDARSRERLDSVKRTWWKRFGEEALTTQTGCALALQFDLVPERERQRFGDRLAELVHEAGDHLATGFLGTPLLLPALSEAGHHDVACTLLLQDSPPSWMYQVKAGATTIWERWDALRPDGSVPVDALAGGTGGMVSFNHYAYGSVAEWLHRFVLGIAPDEEEPGYRHFVVAPRPCAGLTSASGTLRTRFGDARVEWRLEDGVLHVTVGVPPNARATVRLPGSEPAAAGSGTWTFRSP